MKYRAVLFDMDGTVLDTAEDLTDSANACLRHFGLPEIDRRTAEANLGNGSRYYLSHIVPPGTGQEKTEELLSFYLPYYDAHSLIKTRPYPAVPGLLRRLKAAGLEISIISNKPDSAVKLLAQRFFPGVSALGELPGVPRKPRPQMVFRAVEELGLKCSDCVYVGDTEVDIETARNAGMDCISVLWGFRSEERLRSAGAERIAADAEELYSIITE